MVLSPEEHPSGHLISWKEAIVHVSVLKRSGLSEYLQYSDSSEAPWNLNIDL